MNLNFRHYVCPSCKEHFLFNNPVQKRNGGFLDGKLLCRTCGICVPVIDGIPRFVSLEPDDDSFGYQWNVHRKTQLDSYTGLPISRNRLFSVTKWPDKLEGELILEAGSGAGRFTEVLLQTGAFSEAGFTDIVVRYGQNGIVGRGRKPESPRII